MNTVYIDMRRYEIQEQKEVPVWYTGIYPPISSTAYKISHTGNKHKHHNTFKAKAVLHATKALRWRGSIAPTHSRPRH
jgi:hypothetical protein